jgi:hypothetical protein
MRYDEKRLGFHDANCRSNCIRPRIEKGAFAMKTPTRLITKGFMLTVALSVIVGLGATLAANQAAAAMMSSQYEGYLADVLCATRGTALDGADMVRHPEKHSVACLKEPQCVASGYGILTKGKDGTYTFHKFDKKGNELALKLIKKTMKKDSFAVKVSGQMKEDVINVESIMEK